MQPRTHTGESALHDRPGLTVEFRKGGRPPGHLVLPISESGRKVALPARVTERSPEMVPNARRSTLTRRRRRAPRSGALTRRMSAAAGVPLYPPAIPDGLQRVRRRARGGRSLDEQEPVELVPEAHGAVRLRRFLVCPGPMVEHLRGGQPSDDHGIARRCRAQVEKQVADVRA